MNAALRARILTALLLAALVIVVLAWLLPHVAVAMIALAIFAGGYEWAGFARLESVPARLAYAAAILLALTGTETLAADPRWLSVILWIAVVWWLIAFLWLALRAKAGGRFAAAIVGFPVLVPAGVGLSHLVTLQPQGQLLLLYLLVLIAAADVGAYFGGRRFGRRKLAPEISPGKTWEGVYGALAAVTVYALALTPFAAAAGYSGAVTPLGILVWVAFVLLLAGLSVAGDLFESLLKRQAGVKDSGRLLPGHGGILDRIDALLAAMPPAAVAALVFLHA